MARPPTPETSTVWSRHGEEIGEGSHPVAMWLRRAMLTAMALVVAAALLSLLGVRSSTVSAQGRGYVLSLDYPSVARAGLDTPWRATVTQPGGFGKQLTLALPATTSTSSRPRASTPSRPQETRDGHTLYLTFNAPPGDTFVVYYDAYVQPASQQGRSATLAVDRRRRPAVSIDYRHPAVAMTARRTKEVDPWRS